MKTLFVFFISFLHFPTNAGGFISLQGNLLQKCSEQNCQIQVGPQLYIIKLDRLSSTQKKLLKTKKASDNITETIPMAAVLEVKDIK